MQKKISIVSLLIAILLIVTISIGTTYSLWTTSVQQASVNSIDVGCFKIVFDDRNVEGGGNISLNNAYPISNEKGKMLMPYKFSISNQCSVAASYNVNLETLSTSTMDENVLDVFFNDSVIKSYSNNVINGLSDDAKSGMNLTRGYLPAGESVVYSLRVWIDYDVTVDTPNVQGKTWNGRIAVNSEATFSKPAFTNKVIGASDVTLDIDTRSSKTVESIACFYGDKNSQTTAGTAIGNSKCQFPINAEYAKYDVTYTDGTSDTSYAKQLIEYIVKDGVEQYVMKNWHSSATYEDGYVNVLFGDSTNNNSTYFVNNKVFDLSNYYGMYYDISYNLTLPSSGSALFGICALDNGYYDGTQVDHTFAYPNYYDNNTAAVNLNVARQTYSLVFNSANHYDYSLTAYTPSPDDMDLSNYERSLLSFAFVDPQSDGSVNANIYNWYLQLAE